MRISKPIIQPEGSAPEFFSAQVSEARRFFLDLAPNAEVPLAVVCGGCERCAPEYLVRRRTFPYYSIEFVASGRGLLRMQGKEYELEPGRLFLYGPGLPHEISTLPSAPMVKYFVDFTGQQALPLLAECGLRMGQVVHVFADNEVQAVFEDLIRSGLRVTGLSSRLCLKLLEVLILKIAESLSPWEGRETQAFVTYRHCRQFIQENCRRLRSLDQVASECHLNGAYLCRLFRRYDHQTPYQYLLRLRLNLAAEVLQRPGSMVKQAAEEAGFSDPFHFSRAFKSAFGLSPAAFQKLR